MPVKRGNLTKKSKIKVVNSEEDKEVYKEFARIKSILIEVFELNNVDFDDSITVMFQLIHQISSQSGLSFDRFCDFINEANKIYEPLWNKDS